MKITAEPKSLLIALMVVLWAFLSYCAYYVLYDIIVLIPYFGTQIAHDFAITLVVAANVLVAYGLYEEISK